MRKKIALVLCTIISALSFSVEAQQPKKVPRIGLLVPGTQSASAIRIESFRQGLRYIGYIEGQNILIEYRYGDAKPDRLPDLAADLVRSKVDVIVTPTAAGVTAAKATSSSLPIVFTQVNDPVGSGLVASFARPGGNVTGMTNLSTELDGKRLELLKETFPKVFRAAYLCDPNSAISEMQATAQTLGLQLQTLEVRSSNDFDSVFEAISKSRAQALITSPTPIFVTHQKRILEFAAKSRLPAIYPTSDYAAAGGLMSYAHSNLENWRRAAIYVDKILKGAKPADLPVERPTKFEFVINLKTAKQIGLTIPPNVLARADRVIK
jgi:putative ABC transport system substrate-binding protein